MTFNPECCYRGCDNCEDFHGPKKRIIGLSGYAQCGKDTVASLLAERGYVRYAFADIMKEAILRLDPFVGTYRLSESVDVYGWDVAKVAVPEIRRLIQVFGTEVGRELLGPDIWVEALFKKIGEDGAGKVVIADVRFPNEFDAVKSRGGHAWRVTRPGYGGANGHASEHSLEGFEFDAYVDNKSDIQDLRALVLALEAQY